MIDNCMANFSNYIILPELRLIITYYSGTITLKDLIQLNKNFLKDDFYDASYDMLVDFRDSMAIGFRLEIADYYKFLKSNVSIPKHIKNGILYSTSNQKFLISIFQTFSKIIQINTEGFDSISDYFDWMEFDDSTRHKVLAAIHELKLPAIQK